MVNYSDISDSLELPDLRRPEIGELTDRNIYQSFMATDFGQHVAGIIARHYKVDVYENAAVVEAILIDAQYRQMTKESTPSYRAEKVSSNLFDGLNMKASSQAIAVLDGKLGFPDSLDDLIQPPPMTRLSM